jgi:Zn-dependent protease with chaperone function
MEYENIVVQKIKQDHSSSGDLDSNDSVNGSNTNISYRLLNHHKDNDEEILAILAHDIGHWS